MTPRGWRLVGDLQPGDLITGSTGAPTEVIAVYERGVLPVFRVTMRDRISVPIDDDSLRIATVASVRLSDRGGRAAARPPLLHSTSPQGDPSGSHPTSPRRDRGGELHRVHHGRRQQGALRSPRRHLAGALGQGAGLAGETAVNRVIFQSNHHDVSPSQSRDTRTAEKEATGWKYGPKKDADKKEHPCMVSYDQLPAEQRAKDYVYRAIAHAFRDAG